MIKHAHTIALHCHWLAALLTCRQYLYYYLGQAAKLLVTLLETSWSPVVSIDTLSM